MTQTQAKQLVKGQEVLVNGKPATFVTLHTAQNCPGRYSTRALVNLDGRETSVRLKTLAATQ